MEADEKKREEYLEKIKGIKKEDLVYVDETGIEEGLARDRGWSKKGQKVFGKKSGKHYERTNVLGALCGKEAIAPMAFWGSCNTTVFEIWVERFLIPDLKQGQVMDNASFHKSQKTKELIENAG